jgi:tRNA nucleotidyltransferase (CCA-adding enzyme)
MGRHLIDRGREPGPHFGPLLEACFEAQLEGEFQDLEGGLAFLDRLLAERAVAGTPAVGGAKQNGDRFPS